MWGTLAKVFGGSAAIVVGESFAMKSLELASTASFEVPALYPAVLLVNVVGSSFLMFNLGMSVGMSRSKYGVKYPKMYAEGDSEEAVKFNCIQRGHQQALETYPQFLACSLIGGLSSPVSVAFAGLLWCIARKAWANAYAEHGADGRYNSKWSLGIWYSLLFVKTAAIGTIVKMVLA
eukprot:CAMPEP_0177774628 /NCGR_PEP_ID=MMETSP0491_2-20121128/13628_1 /TAXON_ID=63592 /ORGANISM="Tetraselmis chuii, Strain PLY429" /LENGTH=176 /DNA_ID=CAMNT_0019293059 /DNA_START=95 /DNA_END=625 /DNA_ORIENTATION=-